MCSKTSHGFALDFNQASGIPKGKLHSFQNLNMCFASLLSVILTTVRNIQ